MHRIVSMAVIDVLVSAVCYSYGAFILLYLTSSHFISHDLISAELIRKWVTR